MPRFGRLLIPVVVAVVLGPLIGGLAVCVLALASNLVDQTGSLPVIDLFTMFGFYIVFAYISGGAIALLAGILVSIWMISRPPSLIVVVAAAVLATAVELLGSRSRASEVLSRRRALTVDMIHKVGEAWKIPADLLVRPYKTERAA